MLTVLTLNELPDDRNKWANGRTKKIKVDYFLSTLQIIDIINLNDIVHTYTQSIQFIYLMLSSNINDLSAFR